MSELSNDLKSMLGTESGAEWLRFMDKIAVDLPFLLNRGRPTAAAIKTSEIGATGCKSWSEYIEKELSWNVNTWRAWQRAYAKVLEFPYLRGLELTASAINALNAKSDAFPADSDAHKALTDALAAKSTDDAANTLKGLKQRIAELEQAQKDSAEQFEVLRNRFAALQARVGEFKSLNWFKRIFAEL